MPWLLANYTKYTCGSVLESMHLKKVRPLDGILRVKKVRVLTRSIYFLNLTQPRLAPKLDGVMLVAWNGRGDASGDRPDDAVTETFRCCLQIFKKVIVDP